MNTFDKETHAYYIEGKPVPGVTQIASVAVSAAVKPAPNPVALTLAARRGTEVHGICEYIDYGCDPEELDIPPEYSGYVQAYLDFKRDYRPRWDYVERPLYSPALGFAGTLDRYGLIDNIPIVSDIKTTATFDRPAKLRLLIQLTGYGLLCRENGLKCDLTRSMGVQLHKNGKYTVHEYRAMQRFLPLPVPPGEIFVHSLSIAKVGLALSKGDNKRR